MSASNRQETAGVERPPPNYLLMALWFGLLTGLGEVAIRGVQKFLFRQLIFVSPDVVWMAPLADATIFLAAGIVLYFLKRKWPRVISLRTAVFVFAFLAFVGPLLWFPRLYPYAGAILAVGLAIQTARMATAHPNILASLVRRTTGWMAALVVAMGLTLHGWQALAEYRAIKSLPPAPKDAPNLLFIVLDTVRAQSLSLYGYERPTTPNLERLAKRGVVFQHAIATAPWTLPSHASMFTGRFPHELSADWRKPLDATYPTLAEILSDRGYITGGFVANLLYCLSENGLGRGFTHYEDYPVSLGTVAKFSWLGRTIGVWIYSLRNKGKRLVRKHAEEINRRVLNWLSQTGGRPFLAFLNYMDAHEPYFPPKPFDMKFTSNPPPGPLRDDYQYTQEQIEEFKDAYDGAIASLDHQVGSLFDELDKRGLLDNTLVIITSDHGEEFGEHGLMSHGSSLYLPSLHVPLLISFPSRVPAGKWISKPVSLRDIPATVLDLLRIKARFPGTSLAQSWEVSGRSGNSPKSPLLSEVNFAPNLPEWHPVSKGDMKSLLLDGYHYTKDGAGREELYRYETDPWEKRDLAQSEEEHRRVDQFRKSLEALLAHSPSTS